MYRDRPCGAKRPGRVRARAAVVSTRPLATSFLGRAACSTSTSPRGSLVPRDPLLVHLAEVLVLLVAGGLDLERRVVDVEVVGDAAAQLVEGRPHAPFGQAGVGDGDVRGQRGDAAGDRP